MRKLLTIIKWPLLIAINMIPFVLNVLFYENGMMDDLLLFIPCFAGLVMLNYRSFDKVTHFVVIQAVVLLCVICSGEIATQLYYDNISDDPMTPVVGDLFVFLESAITIFATILSAVLKHNLNKNAEKKTQTV